MFRSRSSSSRRVISVALASACACAAVSFAPREAHAAGGFDLGIDGDANALLAPSPNKNNLSTLGGGIKLRFGDRFHLRGGVILTPEVGYAFDHVFPGNDPNGAPENMNRFFAGLRLGVGNRVVPTIYAHIGYGFRSISENGSVGNNAGIAGDNGLAVDTGIAVEFRLARHLSFGPHAEFVYIDVPNAPQWLAFGAHLDFLF
jgi:hypothetical protein